MRHDEILRSNDLGLVNKYNFSSNNKLKLHKMTKVIKNSNRTIFNSIDHTVLYSRTLSTCRYKHFYQLQITDWNQ